MSLFSQIMTVISASALEDHVPGTESVELKNYAQQRARVLDAYTHKVEQLMLTHEESDDRYAEVARHRRYDTDTDESKDGEDELAASGCHGCRKDVARCLRKVDESLMPYKLLYIFIRGGEACLSMYLSVYGLQIGFNPLQLGFIFAMPCLISSLSTPLCGYISDKFRCRKEMLLFALCLWVVFSLLINVIPAPDLATCPLARTQFQNTIAKVSVISPPPLPPSSSTSKARSAAVSAATPPEVRMGLLRNFDASNALCLIPENTTEMSSQPSWLSILHIIRTPWSEKTEECYPGGRFWGAAHVSGGVAVIGPKTTFLGWMFESASLMSSFYAIYALITVAKVMQGTTLALADTATLQVLGPTKSHEYGWQRAFGNAGFAVYILLITLFTNVAASTWSRCGVEIEVEDYRIAFAIFLGTTSCAIALLVAYCIKFSIEYPAESNIFDLANVFCKLNPALLLPVLCFLEANEGAITVFLPFHLSTLGAPILMVKSATIITGASELLLAFHLGQLIESRGHGVLLVTGAVGYLLCFLAYALITAPGWLLPVEVFHGLSRTLTWNVLVAQLSRLVLPENLATLQGSLKGIYYLGRGLGAVIAGVGVSFYGAPITFFCFAFACLVVGMLMGIAFSAKQEKSIRYELITSSDSDGE